MKIISKSNNKNNSRVTVEFSKGSPLTTAAKIAMQHKCGFSHNVRIKPISDGEEITFPVSFGTLSFNKGDHNNALSDFLKSL